METVWLELLKKGRTGAKQYLHPCPGKFHLDDDREAIVEMKGFLKFRRLPVRWLRAPSAVDDDATQEWAIWRFFRRAFHLAYDQQPQFSVASELKKRRDAYRKLAPHLRCAAALLGERGFRSDDQRVLERLAKAFESAEPPEWGHGFAANDKGDRKTRAYVMALAWIAEVSFGKPLAGTLATTASVALARRISSDQVKSILASEIRYPPLFEENS